MWFQFTQRKIDQRIEIIGHITDAVAKVVH